MFCRRRKDEFSDEREVVFGLVYDLDGTELQSEVVTCISECENSTRDVRINKYTVLFTSRNREPDASTT